MINSILLGFAFAIDASLVAMANGFRNSHSKTVFKPLFMCAFVFSFMQGIMAFLGYLAGEILLVYAYKLLPIFAFLALFFIGLNTVIHTLKTVKNGEISNTESSNTTSFKIVSFNEILCQGVATSLDALAGGVGLCYLSLPLAFSSCLVISLITFIFCATSYIFGKLFGVRFQKCAGIIGGLILMLVAFNFIFNIF